MKKIPLTIFTFMLASSQLFAQLNVSLHAIDASGQNGSNAISRCYDRNRDLTAYYYNGKTYIDLVEILPQTIYRAEMPANIDVMDMYIIDDNVFFCGRDRQQNKGIIGYLHIPDYYLSSVAVKYMEVNAAYVLTHIVVQKMSGSYRIAAIGQDKWPYPQQYFYNTLFVDCSDITTNSIIGPIYTVHEFNTYEKIYNLLLTDNYYVCFGYNVDPNINSICYRKAYRTNITLNSLFDSIHYFRRGDEAYSDIRSTAMKKNDIAVTYFYMIGTVSRTRIKTIDIVHDNMFGAWEYILPEKMEPSHVVFLPTNRNLVIMQEFLWNGTYNTNFVQFNPYDFSEPRKVEYKPSQLFQHVTVHDSKYYLASKGRSWFWKDGTLAPTDYPNQNCPKETPINISDTRPLDHLVVPDVMRLSFYWGSISTSNIIPVMSVLSIDCSNR